MKTGHLVRPLVALAVGVMLAAWASPAAAECGDGACDITIEGCYSCSEDCGACPESPGSSCAGLCGYNTESCWCDELCHPYADCCADVCLQCPMLPGCSSEQCGNGTCDEGESCYSCPGDCGDCNLCGDTHCGEQEDCQSCPADCGACETCGDDECVAPEDCSSCPPDCGYCEGCGDGICGELENCFACPDDCGACLDCGNGECGEGENCGNCAEDCGECCGDGSCDGESGEDCVSCPEDCGTCADCGNGECDEGESCDSCPGDCGECCGDGVCDPEKGETCELCPADCTGCESCGDGECKGEEDCSNCEEDCGECCGDGDCNAAHGEDCETCEEDCKKCECTQMPNLGTTWNFAFDFEEEAIAAGTGPGLKLSLNAGIHNSLDTKAGRCFEGLSGGGEVGVCMMIAYQKMCNSFTLDIGGQCEKALTCEAPPQWVCDEGNTCCGGTLMGGLTVSRSFEPEKKFEIWKLKAKCGMSIGVSIGSTLSGNAKWGPLCDCPQGAADLTLRAKGTGSGGGSCGIKAFGETYLGVGANASVCGNIGVKAGHDSCQGISVSPVGGVAFSIKVVPFTIGWFSISGVVKTWAGGSGCSGATDY